MGKLFKFLAGGLLVVVLLLIAAVLIIPLVVDPNDFRDYIVVQVKKNTGLDLTIEGDIGLSVFPWVGAELSGLSLNQPEGFGDEPFAVVKHAQVRAKLMPLLEKKLEVDRVQLEGLKLSLVRNEKGMGNWEDLAKGPATEEQKDAGKPKQKPEGAGLEGLAIGGINVADAQVSWDDRQGGQKVVVQDISLETGTVVPGEPLDVRLNFAVVNDAPKLTGRVELTGTVTATQDGQQVTVEPLELRLTEMKMADGLTANAVLKAGVFFDMAAQKLQVSDLRIEETVSGGALGDMQVVSTLAAQVTADLAAQQFRIEGLNLNTKAKGGQIPGGAVDVVMSADITADLAKDVLDVKGLDLKAAELHLSGHIKGSKIQGDPSFSGKLALSPVNLRELMQKFGVESPQTADPEVLKRLALSTDLNASQKQTAFENLKITLDESNLSGNAKILLNQVPGYRFALKLDAIDLDRYLPPQAEKPAPQVEKPAETDAKTKAPPAGGDQALFPAEQLGQLRQLDIDGSFSVGSLTLNNLKLYDARITIKAKDGDIRLNQKVGRFYQGNLSGNLGLNVKGKTPQVKVAQHVKQVQAESLVKDLIGEDRLAGTGNINLDVSGSGQTEKAIKRSLNGNLNFAFTNGTVKGVNLGRMLREAAAKIQGKTLPPDNEPNETDFSELKGSGVIKNGVLHNDDLSAKSPLFRVTGKGRINIGEDTLDYKVKPVLVASLSGQGGEDLEKLKGVPIPVHLTGPLAKPDWSIDLAEALTESQKAKAKEKIKEEIQKNLPKELQEQLPGGLDQQLDSVLKGLFN